MERTRRYGQAAAAAADHTADEAGRMNEIMGGLRTPGPDPAVQGLDAAVYVVPTDAPEADGTLAWDKTTLVLVTARAGGQQGIGWSYTAAAAAPVVTGILSGVVTGRSALDVPGANEAMTRALRNVGRAGHRRRWPCPPPTSRCGT